MKRSTSTALIAPASTALIARTGAALIARTGAALIARASTALIVITSVAIAMTSALASAQSGCTIDGNAINTVLTQTECDAVVPLFDANPYWFEAWSTDRDPCSISGVDCNDTGLYRISLSGGTIPTSVAALPNLVELELGSSVYAIPPELFSPRLRSLTMETGQLGDLLDLIKNATNLQTVTWVDSSPDGGAKIVKAVAGLSNLEHLTIQAQFDNPPATFGYLPNLKTLELRGWSLTSEFPTGFGSLTSLEELTLKWFNSTSLPNEFANLDNLVVLDLDTNKALRYLPDSIGGAAGLKSLRVVDSSIVNLPSSIGDLRDLERLIVEEASIYSLPESFAKLTNLQQVSFAYSDLRSAPNWIGNWRKLESLNLAATDTDRIPPTIAELKKLRSLDVAGTRVRVLPPELARAKNLRKLVIERSPIDAIPPELGSLPDLNKVAANPSDIIEPTLWIGRGCAAGERPVALFVGITDRQDVAVRVTITDADGASSETSFTHREQDEPKLEVFRSSVRVGPGPYRIDVTTTDADKTETILSQTTRCESVCDGDPGSSTDGVVIGTESDDALTIDETGPVTVCGLGGNDTITVTASHATIVGGPGNDQISVNAPSSMVWGSSGNDTITAIGPLQARGGPGDDTITSGAGDDIINGGSGNDTLSGGAGRDQIRGGTGDDVIDGGDGNDYLLSGNGGRDTITGGAGNDIIYGGPRPDILSGGDGGDLIKGLAGADKLFGQNGADELYAGKGNDMLDGGNDTDVCRNFFGVYTTLVRCEDFINTAQLSN